MQQNTKILIVIKKRLFVYAIYKKPLKNILNQILKQK